MDMKKIIIGIVILIASIFYAASQINGNISRHKSRNVLDLDTPMQEDQPVTVASEMRLAEPPTTAPEPTPEITPTPLPTATPLPSSAVTAENNRSGISFCEAKMSFCRNAQVMFNYPSASNPWSQESDDSTVACFTETIHCNDRSGSHTEVSFAEEQEAINNAQQRNDQEEQARREQETRDVQLRMQQQFQQSAQPPQQPPPGDEVPTQYQQNYYNGGQPPQQFQQQQQPQYNQQGY